MAGAVHATSPFEAAGGISITSDKASNALIIVASPADYNNLCDAQDLSQCNQTLWICQPRLYFYGFLKITTERIASISFL